MDMVHYQLGVLPFENNCGRIPTKRKIEEENLDEGGPTLKKMKYTPYGDMPDNNFPPDEVLLQEGWDDVLLERLQPAIKSANHKRVAATDDFNLISLPRLQPSTTTAGSIETPIHLERRATSEELSLEACIGLKRYHYLNEAVYLSAKHDDPEMSRRSPRNSRKRANISTKESVVDLSSDTEQPLPPQDEGTESAGLIVSLSDQDCVRLSSKPSASPAPNFDIANLQPQENDSIVLFSKRLRPNSGRKLQEPSDTADIPNSTKSISTGNAHTLRSGQGIDGGEGKNASVEGNERDQNESNESKAPIKEKWYASNTLRTHCFITNTLP
jgi:hypothetical protein